MAKDESQDSQQQQEYEHPPVPLESKPQNSASEQGRKRWLRNPPFERAKWTDVAIVFLTAGIVFLGWMHWREMNQGGKDTHDLAVQAKVQADNTKTLAEAASKQATAASEQVQKLQAGVDETHRLAGAAQEAARINREALESVQRAFVIFRKQMQVNNVPDPKDQQRISSWEFRPILENSGTTPTREARHHVNYWYSPVNTTFPPKQFSFPDLNTQSGSKEVPFGLGPKEVATGALLTINPEIVSDVKERKKNLFFWGWATYRDVFPNTPVHISMFCIELLDVRGDLKPSAPQTFVSSLCDRHNCEDDECRGEPYGTPRKIWR